MRLLGYLASGFVIIPLAIGVDWDVGQVVDTSSGRIQGHASPKRPEVSEYLNIPFAKPPVGSLRWAAPERFEGSDTLDGTTMGNSCPAISGSGSSGKSKRDTRGLTETGQTILAMESQRDDVFSEDCLNLNLWTKPQAGMEKKAALVFIHGGAFTSGSLTDPFHDGSLFAEEQDLVVVSINYRLNIFGFPGHPDADKVPYNLGLLDQRLALEWLHDNIQNFGGDPDKITISGYSAGGASVDYLSYAFPDDPIAWGFIPESGTTTGLGTKTKRQAADAWYDVSKTLGCGDSSSDSDHVLQCLRAKDTDEVLGAIPSSDGLSAIQGAFTPTIDNKLVYADAQYETLNPAALPVLIGTTNDEANFFRALASMQGSGAGDEVWERMTEGVFTCPAALRANRSLNHEVPVWRYRYFGDFPNTVLTDDPPSGAWHGSQNLVIFGFSNLTGVPDTEAEVDIAKWMRGAWAAFAKDPSRGLVDYGWPLYNPSADTLARIGFENKTGGNFDLGGAFDGPCRKTEEVTATPVIPDSPGATAEENAGASLPPLTPWTMVVFVFVAVFGNGFLL